MTDIVKRWKRHKSNHGVKITVNDVRNRPWDAPSIFVTMDCAAGLVPLPFEVQTEQEGQQYPALNFRFGSPDDEPDTALPSSAPATPSTRQDLHSPSPTMQGDDPASLYEYNYESDLEEEENKERESDGQLPTPFQPAFEFQDSQTELLSSQVYDYRSSTEAPSTPPTPISLLSQHTTPVPSPTPPMVRPRASSRRRGSPRDMRHRRKHRGGYRRI
ncbi:hypothetical protein E2C01_089528 [Portunus trituberculatus]|uniref:Uncharacterized protein n=1 Tax=Portunus trituberculatus TaxID=210409 RepID=A0A5B7J915_PORTR|nr:hypothetical protein [Portunus trituberculatus]